MIRTDCFWSVKNRQSKNYTQQKVNIVIIRPIKECHSTITSSVYSHSCVNWTRPFLVWIWAWFHIRLDKPRDIASKNISFSLFIDDECNLHDTGEFSKSFHAIYPNELQIKVPLLDVDITIVTGIYKYKFYDKRDKYSFFIVCIPDLSGNISAYVFMVQFYLFSRIAKCAIKFPKIFFKN